VGLGEGGGGGVVSCIGVIVVVVVDDDDGSRFASPIVRSMPKVGGGKFWFDHLATDHSMQSSTAP